MKNKILKLYLFLLVATLLFIGNVFFVQATDLDSAYDTMGEVSDGIDVGIDVAGEKSGEALGWIAGFFGMAGEFLGNLSLRIANFLGQLPQNSAQAGQISYSFMQQYGWAIGAILILLIAGYLLIKLLQIAFFRNFIIRVIAGALIIIGFVALIVWGIKKLPPLPEAQNIEKQAEDTLGLIDNLAGKIIQGGIEPTDESDKISEHGKNTVDDNLTTKKEEEKKDPVKSLRDNGTREEKKENNFSLTGTIKDVYSNTISTAKGIFSDFFTTSQDFVSNKTEEYAKVLAPAPQITVQTVYLELEDNKLKINWQVPDKARGEIKSFLIKRRSQTGEEINVTENLPADYYYYVDDVFKSGLYKYQVIAEFSNSRQTELNNWEDSAVHVRVDCQNEQCFFSFTDSDAVEFSEDEFSVSDLAVNFKRSEQDIKFAIQQNTLTEETTNDAYYSYQPFSMIGNNYFSVSAFNNKQEKISNFSGNPLILKFNISSVPVGERKNLNVAWRKGADSQWEIISGQRLVGEFLEIEVEHLSDFALADRLPLGMILETAISCQNQAPMLTVKGWSYDPDNLAMGVGDVHIYDRTFAQADFKFLFTNFNFKLYPAGQTMALQDMEERPNRNNPYQPVLGTHYGFSITKAIPPEYKAGDTLDVNGYALNFDSYGNRVKRNKLLNKKKSSNFILTVPDCGVIEPLNENLKPRGQVMEALIECKDNNYYLTVKGWSYDPNDLAHGASPVHIYDKNFSQQDHRYLFNNNNNNLYSRGHKVALRDMAIVTKGKNRYQPHSGADYSFNITNRLPDNYHYGDTVEVNGYALNIDNQGKQAPGNRLLARSFPERLNIAVPDCGFEEPTLGNIKNSNSYHPSEVFLISNNNWRSVMELVPVTVWSGEEKWCMRTKSTADKTCIYPTLIFHEEKDAFDVDSIIYFFEQYQPERVTLVGSAPQALADLLVAESPTGAGLSIDQIKNIQPEDILGEYWSSFDDVVYVEDNYEVAVITAPYAALINAPLVVSDGNKRDVSFKNKNIICVGQVESKPISDNDCDSRYGVTEIQELYANLTKTDKIILINSDDLDIKRYNLLHARKGGQKIMEVYSKNSLSAPFLAVAKQEIIISSKSDDYKIIGQTVEDRVKQLMPNIINNSSGQHNDSFNDSTTKIYQQPLAGGSTETIGFSCASGLTMDDDVLFWNNCGSLNFYNTVSRETATFRVSRPGKGLMSMDTAANNMAYALYNFSAKQCEIYHHILVNNAKVKVANYPGTCKIVKIDDEFVVWEQKGEGQCFFGNSCNTGCNSKRCFLGKNICDNNNQCADNDYCMNDFCYRYGSQLHIQDLLTRHTITRIDIDNLKYFDISGRNLAWIEHVDNIGNEVYLYRIGTGKKEFIEEGNMTELNIAGNYLLWREGNSLYAYDINRMEKKLISASVSSVNNDKVKPFINDNTIIWFDDEGGKNNYCQYNNNACQSDNDCAKYCKDSGSCYINRCLPSNLYSYNLASGEKKQISNGNLIFSPKINQKNLYYTATESSNFYINGYLTIFGSSYAIPMREDIGAGHDSNYRALDQTEYADIYLNDRYPDMAVGRIQGLTTSDVSSYVARDIFNAEIQKTSGMLFALREGFGSPGKGNSWTEAFSKANYEAQCIMDYKSGPDLSYCKSIPQVDWPSHWQNRDFIFYADHGMPDWAGIKYNQLPQLNNTLVVGDACLTCTSLVSSSFCNNVIRQGALGYAGAVSVAFAGNKIYDDFVNGVFYEKLDIGTAFAQSYVYNTSQYMTTLLGDPTLNISQLYYLEQPLH